MGGPLGPANPVFHVQMSASCDKAWFGWPCDAELERLRAAWIRETDPVKARWLAEDIQLRGAQVVVYIPFGQYVTPSAWRDNLEALLTVPETVVFWNIRRKSHSIQSGSHLVFGTSAASPVRGAVIRTFLSPLG
jgi:peptide/nickel transport system substrate-binding protein